ncbi:DUF6804 family protein [uncultured Amnibacterium sp.]|uniref:DUF6804 family protein n=1 Tax=uncultured Amnibacterium sp. TaxID=1631851 RepID=UPI0035CA4F3E
MSGNRAQRRNAARTPPTLENRYGSRKQRRALAPATVGMIVLLGGLLLVGQDGYLFIRFGVAILAVITAVFVWQARQWAWLPVPLVVAVLWNPVLPFAFAGQPFRLGHVVGAAALLVTGAFARQSVSVQAPPKS